MEQMRRCFCRFYRSENQEDPDCDAEANSRLAADVFAMGERYAGVWVVSVSGVENEGEAAPEGIGGGLLYQWFGLSLLSSPITTPSQYLPFMYHFSFSVPS